MTVIKHVHIVMVKLASRNSYSTILESIPPDYVEEKVAELSNNKG